MKILIIEQPLNNRGDESAHRGMIHSLTERYPHIKITVLFYGRREEEIDYFRVISANVNYVNIAIKNHKVFSVHRIIKLLMISKLSILLYTP